MHRGVKSILAVLIPLLILGHFLVFFLFFGSLSFVVHFSGLPAQEFISAEEMPLLAKEAFGFVELPQELSLPQPVGVWQGLNQAILRGRYRKMEVEERRVLFLNVLPFGGDVFGLNGAAFYYFKKSLSQLSAEEMVNLAGFFRVFSK